MADHSMAAANADQLVNEAFAKIHDSIGRACAIAEANVKSPYVDWKSGARLYLDFCTFAMRRAQPQALSNPHRCAGEIRRSRIFLKKIIAGIPPGRKFPQPIIDAAHGVNADIDSALLDLQTARALNRQGQDV